MRPKVRAGQCVEKNKSQKCIENKATLFFFFKINKENDEND